MVTQEVYVKNADRMMTRVNIIHDGLELSFADGCKGLVPFKDIPEIKNFSNLVNVELPNPYEVILNNASGEVVELPWDFVRHYCDKNYRPQAETTGKFGRETIGKRIRHMREQAGLTQETLASSARVGRITLIRIERGEQSPRYDTLLAIAKAFNLPIQRLLADNEAR